jgi:hypothetical protein
MATEAEVTMHIKAKKQKKKVTREEIMDALADNLFEWCERLEESGHCPCCIRAAMLMVALAGEDKSPTDPIFTIASLDPTARARLKDAVQEADAFLKFKHENLHH